VVGGGRSPTEILFWLLPGHTKENQKYLRIVGAAVLIRTRHLANESQKRNASANLLVTYFVHYKQNKVLISSF
jgi:hypothetical protein